jgi:hypothetical protein
MKLTTLQDIGPIPASIWSTTESRVATPNQDRAQSDEAEGLMTNRSPSRKRKLPCPWFEVEAAQGLPHSCNGFNADTMADVRRHMVRGQRPHIPFLRLCPTCNETFMDKDLFESAHGQYCHNNRKQHRGEAVEAQWNRLYGMIFEKVNAGNNKQSQDSRRSY